MVEFEKGGEKEGWTKEGGRKTTLGLSKGKIANGKGGMGGKKASGGLKCSLASKIGEKGKRKKSGLEKNY